MSESDRLERVKPRSSRRQPQIQQPDALKCPRCESPSTKFCYYNNYNKTQPRYFCKSCKRHWTKGGTLRNVPVGGGQKHKRLILRSNITATTTATATMIIRNKYSSIDQDNLQSDHKDTSDLDKAPSFKPSGSERSDDVESYTDIEELKGLVSWDFDGSFIGCDMQELADDQEDHPRLGFSKILNSIDQVNPSSNIPRSFIEMLENGEDSTSIAATSMMMPSFQQSQVPASGTSNFLELNNWNWNDLDKPWEDPAFKT